ncbi:tetratricopeptide repeat protein [Sulfuracidifex metallicus]|uniref:tetratricopeptide repeat protein n=1 Tax=Sulfuracidifex metallicus TaxID=47303 RepID=UPI0022738CD8|nr:tetratricopeptide repeat protein [Sulfuracidifex metallicus]MCY0850742.1 tetratricopeptide repeat protein [Sulfuracidifex metallicus]
MEKKLYNHTELKIQDALDLIHSGKIKEGIDVLIKVYKETNREDVLSFIMQHAPERLHEATGEEYAITSAMYFADNKRYNLCMKILEDLQDDLATEARINCFLKANEIDLAWAEAQKLKDPSTRKVGEGIIYSWLGKKDEAEKLFREAMELNPKNQETLINLAVMEIERGNYKESLNLLNDVEVIPDEIALELCDKLNDGVSLQKIGEKWKKIEPERVEASLCLSKAYDLQEDYDKALELLKGIEDWRAYLFSGVIKEKKRDLEGAFQDLSKSETLCKHNQSEVTFEIALVLQKMKKDKDALDKAREAMIKAKNSKNGLIQALSCALIYKIAGKMECGKGIICSNFNLIKEKIGELNDLKC